MFNPHPFRKAVSLIILYSVVIIGIFVLQFKNESVISRSSGLLSFSLAQTQDEDGTTHLKNSIQINFKGISFSSDELHPAYLSVFGKAEPQPLEFISYDQITPLSYAFNFSNDVSLIFTISDTSSSASLSIQARIPENAESVILNYQPSSGFSVTEKTNSRIMLNSKNLAYAFTGPKITDESILLSSRNPQAVYAIYDPTVLFTFASLDQNMIIAQKSTFDSNIKTFRDNTITLVENAIQNSQNVTENSIIAYVAELASRGNFAKAVETVPESFKKGNKRTYLSAPYFNTLEAMYPTLTMYNANMAELISNSVSSNSLNAFTVSNLADYLNILPANETVKKLLAIPDSYISDNKVTLSQAVGILSTYIRLEELHSSLAERLHSSAQACLSVIEASCSLSDSALLLNDRDTPVSNILALEAGMSLIRWGNFNDSESHRTAGYALVNSILAGIPFDYASVGDAYPILVSNPNYPHYTVLHRSDSKTTWTWTCATNFTYSMQNGVATISVKFNKGESHYITICNVDPFSEIEIYGLSFHSDPRFETYNSSGFIYRESEKTLFLKSRQKSETEIIRLTYR